MIPRRSFAKMGIYTLAITPRPVLQRVDGQQQMSILGVPYGSLPRLVLIHIMTEAVRTRTRHIVLGSSFTDWMRRMGFRSISYGPRGSATLIRQQLDRLLACDWTIRWDNENTKGDQEFAVKEVKLTNEYAGTTSRHGGFSREILLTEGFFDHLREHAVPLDENAVRQIRDLATSLDLYTWLSYRLPRINKTRPILISWPQLAVHFGNEGNNIRKFRQTIRDAWERQVSAVYPEARAEFDTTAICLYASPAPLARRPLRLVAGTTLEERAEIAAGIDTEVHARISEHVASDPRRHPRQALARRCCNGGSARWSSRPWCWIQIQGGLYPSDFHARDQSCCICVSIAPVPMHCCAATLPSLTCATEPGSV